MNCPYCDSRLIWQSSWDLDEISIGEDQGIMECYTCSNSDCGCEAEFILRKE